MRLRCREEELKPYVAHIDLRTCVVDGFDFDPDTIKWWARQSGAAKDAVINGLPLSIHNVSLDLLLWIKEIVTKYQLESVCLWCQGMDVDIAILRNLCRKYHQDLESIVPHTSFRDWHFRFRFFKILHWLTNFTPLSPRNTPTTAKLTMHSTMPCARHGTPGKP